MSAKFLINQLAALTARLSEANNLPENFEKLESRKAFLKIALYALQNAEAEVLTLTPALPESQTPELTAEELKVHAENNPGEIIDNRRSTHDVIKTEEGESKKDSTNAPLSPDFIEPAELADPIENSFLPGSDNDLSLGYPESQALKLPEIPSDISIPTLTNMGVLFPDKNQSASQGQPAPKQLFLANAKAGEPYTYIVTTELLGLPSFKSSELSGADETGLSWNPETLTLSGTPKNSGDFAFKLTITVSEDAPGKVERTLRLYVNPDPDSLWQNNAPPENAPYKKESHDLSSLQSIGLKAFGASIRGKSHAHSGSFREDDLLLKELPGGWLYAAVADGAGSATFSREGSRLACSGLYRFMQNEGEALAEVSDLEKARALMQRGITHIRRLIADEAANVKAVIKDFNTTFLVTLLRKGKQGYDIISYWIGDGGLAINSGEGFTLLGNPDGGEFSGQTRFLTMDRTGLPEDIAERTRFLSVPKIETIALLTDGVTDPVFSTDANLASKEQWAVFWEDFTKNVEVNSPGADKAALQWLGFKSKGNYDDRTIALIVPDVS
ncbi:MAG: protein phosphatase 2C domain-containing protein [Bacteroidota bacterium]